MRKVLAFLWQREGEAVRMPEGAKVVSAESQDRMHRAVRVIVECDNSKEYVTRRLVFVEAGDDVPHGAKLLCQIAARDLDCFLYDLGEEKINS